jgi:hypothetical protein
MLSIGLSRWYVNITVTGHYPSSCLLFGQNPANPVVIVISDILKFDLIELESKDADWIHVVQDIS